LLFAISAPKRASSIYLVIREGARFGVLNTSCTKNALRRLVFRKLTDCMEYLNLIYAPRVTPITGRYVFDRGALFFIWAFLVCTFEFALHLMSPDRGIQVGAALVCACLVIQVKRAGVTASGPVLLFAVTLFLFVWARPLISFSSDDFDLKVIETLTDLSVTANGMQVYFGALIASMAAFSGTVLCFQFSNSVPIVPQRTDADKQFRESAWCIWRLFFLVGAAASCVQSALYVRYFLSGASYYDLYIQGPSAVGYPGLSLVASFLFYGYLGMLLVGHADPSHRTRRQRSIWTAAFVLLSLFGLARGSRGEIFTQLLVGLWMYSFTSGHTISIKKAGICGAVLYWLSQLVGAVRAGTSGEQAISLGKAIAWFVYTQGLSGELVAPAAKEFGVGATNLRFIFSPLLAPLRRLFDPSFGAQTVQNGQSSGLLAHELAFRSAPSAYLMGQGMGSSYIAECYCALGVIGVIAGTAILAWIVLCGPRQSLRSRSALFVFSGCLPYILFVPRESFVFPLIPALKALVLLMICRRLSNFYVYYSRRSNVYPGTPACANDTDLHSERRSAAHFSR
jgi:oligosaccharide repeat unit polymerase